MLLLTTVFIAILPGFVNAAWKNVRLASGAYVCEDDSSHVQFKPPYSAKGDVTRACNTLTSFVPWLGTANAAPIRLALAVSQDGTYDTGFPNGDKPPTSGAIDFLLASQSIAEDGGTFSVCLARTVGTTGAITAQVTVTGGTAGSGDYTTADLPATLSWGAGINADQCATVHVTNRSGTQGNRTLILGLASFTGGAVAGTTTQVQTVTITDAVTNAVKWHPGYYLDCYTEVAHGDGGIALNNVVYTQIKSCMDFAATQSNFKGVFVLANWTSFEGSTAGCYDSSCGNGLASAGNIGFPLWDALFAYAASKNLKVIVGLQWSLSYTGACGSGAAAWAPDSQFPAYLIQTSCSGGTDGSSTYGLTFNAGGTGYTFAQLWETNWTNREIAMAQAYGTRYDNNAVVEEFVFMHQDPSFLGSEGTDGFTWASLATQMARVPAAVRPYWLHTNLGMETNWLTPSGGQTVAAAMGSSAAYFTVEANNSIPWQTTYGENTYLGLGTVSGQNFGTHDYRTEIPFTVWTSGPELCDNWDSKPGADAANNYTPLEFYNFYMTTGKSDESSPKPLQPSKWIFSRAGGLTYCPSVANQQWGTASSGGWNQNATTHAVKSTAPSLYPAVNTN